MFTLAEISDKVGTVPGALMQGVVLAALTVGVSLARWWLSLLAVPLIVIWNWLLFYELREPGFGAILLAELGHHGIAWRVVGFHVPLMAAFAAVVRTRAVQVLHERQENELCTQCGFDMRGLGEGRRCPECGTDRAAAACMTEVPERRTEQA